mmetsp:Transcript_48161/g.86662  ORF Transcript_48161/g.86662 Transcript_48161/m.86662 type:complete len:243 (+) Transcript_48161:427-1155(+)
MSFEELAYRKARGRLEESARWGPWAPVQATHDLLLVLCIHEPRGIGRCMSGPSRGHFDVPILQVPPRRQRATLAVEADFHGDVATNPTAEDQRHGQLAAGSNPRLDIFVDAQQCLANHFSTVGATRMNSNLEVSAGGNIFPRQYPSLVCSGRIRLQAPGVHLLRRSQQTSMLALTGCRLLGLLGRLFCPDGEKLCKDLLWLCEEPAHEPLLLMSPLHRDLPEKELQRTAPLRHGATRPTVLT